MKKLIYSAILLTWFGLSSAHAQHVSVRIGFPGNIRVAAPGPAPYAGGIWIGPEWQWRSGRYEAIPGYWSRPSRYSRVWIQGHWQYSRRGYRWVRGHWR